MSDLEFQHELSPDQLSEALSLLENTAGAKPRELHSGEEANSKPDQADASVAEQDRFPIAQDPKQRPKHLNQAALRFCGLGIAAAAALTVLSWSESMPVPPSGQRIVYEQLPNELRAPLVMDASAARPASNSSSDGSPGGSERQPSEPTAAATGPGDRLNRDDARTAVQDAANSPEAASDVAETVTPAVISKGTSQRHERRGQKPKEARRRPRIVRVAKIDRSECPLFACLVWQPQHVFYEPPRNAIQ